VIWTINMNDKCRQSMHVLLTECLLLKSDSIFIFANLLYLLSEGQQLLLPSRITLSLESASQGTSPACWSWRRITLIWSHTRQFVISFITTVTIHYSSLPLQAQNSSFPQILSSTILLPFHPLDWLHRLQLFFVFLWHVCFNFGTVC